MKSKFCLICTMAVPVRSGRPSEVCAKCLSPGPMRHWAANLALGQETSLECISSTNHLFQQPFEAQCTAEASNLGFQNRVQQEETGAISSTTIFRQPFEAQHTAEVPKLLSTSLDGSSNFDLDSTQTKGNFLQRPGEAQCTVKGKTFTARSAEQFRVGASNCLAHDKGLQDESQRTQGKSLASRGCWGGALYPSKPRL